MLAVMLSALLNQYPHSQSRHDELFDQAGHPRPHWQGLLQNIAGLSASEMQQRVDAVRRQVRDNGVTYNVYADTKGLQRPWDLDVLPFILPHEEWQAIETAVIQRATLLNRVLCDIYADQALVHEGIVPASLIHSHAGFLRPCHGMSHLDNTALHFYAVDIARSPDGQWWVAADRTQAPSGAGYTLENRTIISSLYPDLFRDLNIQRLSGFFGRFRDSLNHWGRRCAELQSQHLPSLAPLGHGEQPLIVILTPGPYNETYHEQSYLAGYLGFPLVQGNDLTVRNGIVWLKTLTGLQPVHAIWRRLDDDFCDPLELNSDSVLGVAGITEVARRGHVLIANALGSNLLQSGALLGYLPALCQYYLGETLQMPSVATWWCGEPVALETVLGRLEELVIKPAFPQIREVPIFGDTLNQDEKSALRQKLIDHPDHYIAQELVQISQAPVWDRQAGLHALATGLRVFVCATPQGYIVLPGGLTRVATGTDGRVITMQRGGTSKDTWITAPTPVYSPSLFRKNITSQDLVRGNSHLSSRTVENLFWFGRYAVRINHMARLLRTAIHYTLEFAPDQRADDWSAVHSLCIWYGLMPVEESKTQMQSGQSQTAGKAQDRVLNLEQGLIDAVFSTDKPSLRQHVDQFFQLAFNLRERLSQDNWRQINFMSSRFQQMTATPSLQQTLNHLDRTTIALVTLSGFALDGMTRDQGWRFISIGRRIERLQFLCSLLIRALSMPASAKAANANLEWLLELTDSIVTYRYRYVTQPEWLPLLDLLLLDENNPNAMVFQLNGLVKYLRQLSTQYAGCGWELRFMSLQTGLYGLDIDRDFVPGSPLLLQWLNETYDASIKLSDQISLRFFSHTGWQQEMY